MKQKELNEILKKYNAHDYEDLIEEGYVTVDFNENHFILSLSGLDLSGLKISFEGHINHYINLSNACLRGTRLVCVNCHNADLSGADLTGAILQNSIFYKTNFSNANLRKADLSNGIFDKCDFTGADFHEATLTNARLGYAKNIPEYVKDMTRVCPKEGSFIGWKWCMSNKIVKLEIPENAKRSNATSRKCRCSKAKVISIEDIYGKTLDDTMVVNGIFGDKIIYKIGKMAYPDSFDENNWNECSHGIHFFMTREEAVEYGEMYNI